MMQRMKAGFLVPTAAAVMLAVSPGHVKAQGENAESIITVATSSGAYLAGRVAESDNNLESAIAYYQTALALDPNDEMLKRRLLRTLVAQGSLNEAIPYARQLTTDPEAERLARLVLAIDAFRDQDYIKAERWLIITTETDLDRLISESMLAWAKTGQNEIEAGQKILNAMDRPEWFRPFRDYQQALIFAYNKQDDKAAESFQKLFNGAQNAMAMDTFARITEAYVTFLSSRGKQAEALAILEEAINAGLGVTPLPNLKDQLAAGEILPFIIENPVAGAAEVLLTVAMELSASGGDSFVQFYLNLYLHYGLALQPESDAFLVQLARVSERLQQPELAISYYNKIGAQSPWARFADFQIGLNLADLDRNDEAVDHLEDVLESDPTDLRAYLALGRVYTVQEDFQSAAELYDRAVEEIGTPGPQHWNIFYQRGISYERLKEWSKAEPNFKKALELYPDQPQVLNYLGYSWIDMDINLDEGMKLIKRAAELRPSDGYIIDSLGWAYYKLGKFDDAVINLERAVSLRPEDPILNDHLGDIYWQVGRKLEAIFQWSHALSLKPEDSLKDVVELKIKKGLPESEVKTVVATVNGSDSTSVDTPPVAAANEDAEREQKAVKELTYTVKAGQSLWSIAAEQLGNGERFSEILKLNPFLHNPNLLWPDMTLQLPGNGDSAGAVTATATDGYIYTVKQGQSLWSIAEEQLGNGRLFPEIIRLNPSLKDPNHIQPEMDLKLPVKR